MAAVLAIAVFLPACGTGANAAAPSAAPSVGSRVGYLAPGFTLFDLKGQQVRLEDFRGRPVVVNFWATD